MIRVVTAQGERIEVSQINQEHGVPIFAVQTAQEQQPLQVKGNHALMLVLAERGVK